MPFKKRLDTDTEESDNEDGELVYKKPLTFPYPNGVGNNPSLIKTIKGKLPEVRKKIGPVLKNPFGFKKID